jgi:predicted nucleic acid-binding protein
MIRYKRPYLDSSVYISAIQGESGRAEIVRPILDAADRGDIQVVGSTFVVAEVIRLKGEEKPLPPSSESAIDSILRNERILWAELDYDLAIEARRLARLTGLKPGDAIHFATAFHLKADVLLRWDSRFEARSTVEGLTLCDPYWYGDVPLANPESA